MGALFGPATHRLLVRSDPCVGDTADAGEPCGRGGSIRRCPLKDLRIRPVVQAHVLDAQDVSVRGAPHDASENAGALWAAKVLAGEQPKHRGSDFAARRTSSRSRMPADATRSSAR